MRQLSLRGRPGLEAGLSRIVVIGGGGHVGSDLVPALVGRGRGVVNVSRGAAKPYRSHDAWHGIENVSMHRAAEEKAGRFDEDSTRQVVEALRGRVGHCRFCSSIRVCGSYTVIPSTESPFDPIPMGSRRRLWWRSRRGLSRLVIATSTTAAPVYDMAAAGVLLDRAAAEGWTVERVEVDGFTMRARTAQAAEPCAPGPHPLV